jgi:hypothetical protein
MLRSSASKSFNLEVCSTSIGISGLVSLIRSSRKGSIGSYNRDLLNITSLASLTFLCFGSHIYQMFKALYLIRYLISALRATFTVLIRSWFLIYTRHPKVYRFTRFSCFLCSASYGVF